MSYNWHLYGSEENIKAFNARWAEYFNQPKYKFKKIKTMTNSFRDFLKTKFPEAPDGEEWEYFCEAGDASQFGIIEEYAKEAWDASAEHQIGFGGKRWENFNQWKNYEQ